MLCPICLEPAAKNITCERCQHWSHLKCLQEWAKKCKYGVPTCPTCRNILFIDKLQPRTLKK